MTIGETIRFFRKNKGITITYVVDKLNKSPSWLSLIEKNQRRINANDLVKLLDVIGVPERTFFKKQRLNETCNIEFDKQKQGA